MFKYYLFDDIESYKCSGTPADCIKIAKHHVLIDGIIDLIVSGINHGSNSSISVLYSGTMSAAIEGAIENTPSIGFSLCDFNPNADMNHFDEFIIKIIQNSINLKPNSALIKKCFQPNTDSDWSLSVNRS